MSTIEKKKPVVIVKSEVVKRLPCFIRPDKTEGAARYFIQAVYGDGEMKTLPATRAIWEKVRGTRSGDQKQKTDLGIRKLSACDYLLHFDKDNVIVGIDLIPSRFFVRGASPLASRDAVRKGFLLLWDEDLNGFELKNENLSDRDRESNDFFRVGYLGLTQRSLLNLLKEIREAGLTSGKVKSAVIAHHKVSIVEENTLRVIPTAGAIPKEGRLNS